MKKMTLFLISSLLVAQTFAADVINQRRLIRIMPVYQRWMIAGDSTFSELSIPVLVYFPIRYNLSLSLSGSQATANGGDLAKLSGLTDTQLALSYHVESANLLLNLGVNLPSGKNELTLQQLATSSVLSSNVFQFHAPNFGQGPNISPGATLALPVRDNLVLGLGAAYQYKGRFTPLIDSNLDYDPGDEILLTGGFDVRLNPTATLTGDVILTFYGMDKINSREVFGAGNKQVASLQFRKYLGFDEIRLLARYRSRAKNELIVGGVLASEAVKTNPNQVEFLGHYRRRFSRRFSAQFFAESRFFQNTPAFEGVNLFGAGVAPSLMLSSNLYMLAQFKYQTGSFEGGARLSGLEAGLGMAVSF